MPNPAKIDLVKTIGTATVSKTGNASISITVPEAGVSAGDTVVVAVEAGTFQGAVACSDSQGNTYSVDADVNSVGRLFICSARSVVALKAGEAITATYPAFSGMTVASATEFSGLSGVDQMRVASGNNAKPSSQPITTTRPTELLISVISHNSTPVFTSGCGFTPATEAIGGSGGSQKTIDLGYQVASAVGTFSACGTLSPSGQRWRAAIIAYY
jgi:hypothetical protein